MFAKKYTKKHYQEAFFTGVALKPYEPPQKQGQWRPAWLGRIRLTRYYYEADDLWMAYWEGFNGHPMPKEKK